VLIFNRLHLRTHEIYKCEICDELFRDSKDAKKDFERHKQSKAHQEKLGLGIQAPQFVCPLVWCGKSSSRKDNINRHIRTQHPGHVQFK